MGPLPTVFIDFNHWRLAGSQKKHCVMCSFLAFIRETQCSAVTLPSSPGNLPTPCGTAFIGGDRARGLGWLYLFIIFFSFFKYICLNVPARISEQPVLCSHRLVKLWGGIVGTPKGDGLGDDENGEYRHSPVLLLLTFLRALLGRG